MTEWLVEEYEGNPIPSQFTYSATANTTILDIPESVCVREDKENRVVVGKPKKKNMILKDLEAIKMVTRTDIYSYGLT